MALNDFEKYAVAKWSDFHKLCIQLQVSQMCDLWKHNKTVKYNGPSIDLVNQTQLLCFEQIIMHVNFWN